MAQIKVTLSTPDGEVLDQFTVLGADDGYEGKSPAMEMNELAHEVREAIDMKFDTED